MTPTELRAQIASLEECIYLNCGWAGPSPWPVLEAIEEILDLEASAGPASPDTVARQFMCLAAARAELAQLLGTDPTRVALTGNATGALGIVAAGLDWRPGDEVITTNQEHSSNALPWYQLQRHFGVALKQLEVVPDTERLLEQCAQLITPRTRLMSVSHVVWTTGQILPLRELGELIHGRDGFLIVDGAQGTGQVPVNVEEMGVDCYSAPGQKWLLGPSGTGGAYFAPTLAETLVPRHLGWASAASCDDPTSFALWPDARRFETATVSFALYAGLARAIRIIRSLGVGAIRDRIQDLVDDLRDKLSSRPAPTIASPADPHLRTGLFTVCLPSIDAERAAIRLYREYSIAARCIPSIGALRFSIHAYNTEAEMARVAEALGRL